MIVTRQSGLVLWTIQNKRIKNKMWQSKKIAREQEKIAIAHLYTRACHTHTHIENSHENGLEEKESNREKNSKAIIVDVILLREFKHSVFQCARVNISVTKKRKKNGTKRKLESTSFYLTRTGRFQSSFNVHYTNRLFFFCECFTSIEFAGKFPSVTVIHFAVSFQMTIYYSA